LEHLNRDIERQGLPKKSGGIDKDGRQTFVVDDPRDAVRARIAKKKAERDKRMAEPLPPEIDILSWLKRQQGKTLTAIPAPKTISESANLAKLFDEKCAAHDASRLDFNRTQKATLPLEEGEANIDAYCDAIREKRAGQSLGVLRIGPLQCIRPL
jgi:hypothetical protein